MPARLAKQEEPLPGYKLLERLGRGGFGEVWKVEAPGGFMKAMKFVFGDLDATDEEGRPAEQELKALNRVKSIRHPYILSLERFDIVDGQLIIVMELADRNLWDRFRECRGVGLPGIPREELLRYMEECAEALDLMNNHYQIQHLDIKPQNIFLVFQHVKVADFGLAKAVEGRRATVTGGVTPVYAAPETFEGWISRFSDQYSLAIVFQEMLTGTRPFNGTNTKQLLLQHLNAPPDVAALPEADRPIIERALSKKPDERWPTCMDMVRAIKSAGQSSPDTPRPAGTVENPELSGLATKPAPPRAAPAAGTGKPGRQSGTFPAPNTGSGSVRTPAPAARPTISPRPGSASGLLTPRLVTPQAGAGGSSPALTLQRAQIFQTGRMSSLGIAPPEKTGDGVLFPALVVGVGETGLAVIRRLRQMIRDRFATTEAIPNVRFLYLDTDPEAAVAATQGPDALSAREVVLTKLNRAGYYLQEAAIPPVDAWLPPGLLYKLARNPGPAGGVRAYGRLALCDNYRVVAQRIRQEIETFLTDDPLDRTGAQTMLGVRSNRPLAYVVAGLAGGTGSGMFLDLAYILKHELRGVGYRKPEAVGVLLVPPADHKSPKTAALANTFAAVAELHHFAAGAKYQTKFDNNEAPITDTEGPFARCAVVQLPRVPKAHDLNRAFGLAARGLFVELLTPAGRVTDYVRSVTPAGRNAAVPVAQVFGMYRLAWPRAELLGVAAQRFKQRLLQRWSGKEATHLREPIRQWLQEQWVKQKLDPKLVFERLGEAAHEALRESPTAVFEAAVDTLRTRTPGGGRANAAAACAVFEQIIRLVGKPPDENAPVGSLEVAIEASHKQFLTQIESALAAMSVSFIEQPQYRLAGAEEALNQLADRLKHTIEDMDYNRGELAREVRELYTRVFQVIGALDSTTGLGAIAGRRGSLTNELLEVLPEYARKRFRLIEYHAALALYRTLFGNIPEYLREVAFCRGRLGALGQTIAEQGAARGDSGAGVLLLPEGCQGLDDAADQFLGALAPEDILNFDQTLQREMARRFRGIVNVCLKPEKSPDFLALLTNHAREFLDARLERTDPATVFLRYRGAGEDARKLLADGFARAAPEVHGVAGESPMEAAIFAVPAGSSGAEVRSVMAAACPGVEFIPAPLPDDILIYRECPRVELAALPQFGAHAREAYDAQQASDAPPHARVDIAWQ